ncbi:MAG: cation:proton antiporter, partial [Candidatus Aenigmatarchaeota archaeon]
MALPLLAVEFNLVFYIGLIIILGTVFGYVARIFRQPTIIAYLMTGIIFGPFGLGVLTNQEEIVGLSELGIAFLLFIVGLDLNISKLKTIGVPVFVISAFQMLASFFSAAIITHIFGFGLMESFYLGLTVAFSSTLVVVKFLSDRKKIASLAGRWSLGILIMQDIFAVLILSVIPNFGSYPTREILMLFISGVGLISTAIVLNKFIFPTILKYSAQTRELFFLTSLSTAFLFISLSHFLGFSIAVGGFLAGIALASYPYNVGIESEVRPLRDFFLVIFFTTLGMQVNPFLIKPYLGLLLVLLALVLLIKPISIIFAMNVFGYKKRVPVFVGLWLAQASEFSFVIAQEGLNIGHISAELASVITLFALFTMAVSPYIFSAANLITNRVARAKEEVEEEKELEGHVIILGCHKAGKYVIENLNHPFICVDHDPDIIENLKENGMRCVYGEADNEDILEAVGVRKAKLLISTTPSLETNTYIIRIVKA